MKTFLYILLQCTWGCLQTFIGLFLFLLHIRCRHWMFHGAVITEWKFCGSASLGMFLFIGEQDVCSPALLRHEYGHSLQSLALGPLYIPIAALPSFLWFWLPVCRRIRKEREIGYYSFYTEKWADQWGKKNPFIEDKEVSL